MCFVLFFAAMSAFSLVHFWCSHVNLWTCTLTPGAWRQNPNTGCRRVFRPLSLFDHSFIWSSCASTLQLFSSIAVCFRPSELKARSSAQVTGQPGLTCNGPDWCVHGRERERERERESVSQCVRGESEANPPEHIYLLCRLRRVSGPLRLCMFTQVMTK